MTDLPAITKPQAEALASLLHELRPEWGIPALMTLIGKNRAHPARFPQLAQAAVAAAIRTNPDGSHTARTPAVIYQPGRHWDQPVMEAGAVVPPGPPCEDHPTEAAHNCRACWGDVRAGIRPHDHIGKHHEPQEQAS
ncbi:hypothetical protein HYQ00_gp63 [Arthrobacter phage TripleJ]|uniref:Uncharacterized protein n=1 Tax=Arthrobacter phage TripleJ TaxID=2599838 RepID=A0A5J6TI50_9CAUD|nr:hypothetical protein HYQ00_gp63 [Arthrobacter phage TripleJ]QFG09607.1 hypothetical protein PBI_TRIPLEJ_63 [Arthrobacter phage TripleJ]